MRRGRALGLRLARWEGVLDCSKGRGHSVLETGSPSNAEEDLCFTRAREYHNGHDLASVTPRRNAHHTLQAQSRAISRTTALPTELHQTRLVPHKGCSDASAGRDPV